MSGIDHSHNLDATTQGIQDIENKTIKTCIVSIIRSTVGNLKTLQANLGQNLINPYGAWGLLDNSSTTNDNYQPASSNLEYTSVFFRPTATSTSTMTNTYTTTSSPAAQQSTLSNSYFWNTPQWTTTQMIIAIITVALFVGTVSFAAGKHHERQSRNPFLLLLALGEIIFKDKKIKEKVRQEISQHAPEVSRYISAVLPEILPNFGLK